MATPPNVSGCVPFYNNATTVLEAINSLRQQQPPPNEIIAIDDGSTDGGAEILQRVDIKVVRLPFNQGRGAARARAIKETHGDYVLTVDATKTLSPEFLASALRHMADPKVAAVCGRNWQLDSTRTVARWRGRHLFKMEASFQLDTSASLNTNGALLRREAVAAVGGFNPSLKHSEDAELSRRLTQAGWKIIFDPTLLVTELTFNTWTQVFERVWRYNIGRNDRFTIRSWFVFVKLAWGVMLRRDLSAGDIKCALATFCLPFILLAHWSAWSSSSPRSSPTS